MGKKRTAAEAAGAINQKPFGRRNGGKDKSRAPPKDGFKKNAKPSLIFHPRPDWHNVDLTSLAISEDITPPPAHVLDAVQEHAQNLLQAENTKYNKEHLSATSSHKFLSTIMSSGTLEDKVSALTLLVQESPLHTTKAFENLLGLARKKSRNHALMALGALKDLLGQGAVLPPDRKLRYFQRQPALLAAFSQGNKKNNKISWKGGDPLPNGLQEIHLIVWAFEDWLKRTYFDMLRVLEGWCNDEIEYSRGRALTMVWELLKDRPEQEENLLRLVVNKLGDTAKKVASRASHLLLQLQNIHPAMTVILISAIESELLFKPGQSSSAKYYAIITLNQTILRKGDQQVADKLLTIYFSLFVQLLKMQQGEEVSKPEKEKIQGGGGKKGGKVNRKAKRKEAAENAEVEMAEKLIAQVLAGVNRAFPYADPDDETFTSSLDTIYRITHASNFNTSVQALTLLQQISTTKHQTSDRFYRTLYESLLDPRLLTFSKQVMYLNLLHRSLKADLSSKRVQAFTKRLLQVASLSSPPFAVGIICVVRSLEEQFPSIRSMIITPEEEDEEEHFVDVDPDGVDRIAIDAPRNSDPISDQPHYDGRKRDPSFAHADRSCMWDLLPLTMHYHPTCALYARALLQPKSSEALGLAPTTDPANHTLSHFLDRFAYRNPKSSDRSKEHGSSIMQPLAGAKRADMLFRPAGGLADKTQPVNTTAFWEAQQVKSGKEDVAFFQAYFEKSGKGPSRAEKKRKKQQQAGSDEDEDEIWQALVRSKPEVEGDDDDEEGFDADEVDWEDSDEEPPVDEYDMGIDEEGDEGVQLVGFSDDEDEADLEGDIGRDSDGDEDDDGFPDLDSADEDAMFNSEDEIPDPQPEPGDEQENKSKKRRKLKHLPTFASVEDYAKLLEDEDEGM